MMRYVGAIVHSLYMPHQHFAGTVVSVAITSVRECTPQTLTRRS